MVSRGFDDNVTYEIRQNPSDISFIVRKVLIYLC